VPRTNNHRAQRNAHDLKSPMKMKMDLGRGGIFVPTPHVPTNKETASHPTSLRSMSVAAAKKIKKNMPSASRSG
jgi:hypothetical protein